MMDDEICLKMSMEMSSASEIPQRVGIVHLELVREMVVVYYHRFLQEPAGTVII